VAVKHKREKVRSGVSATERKFHNRRPKGAHKRAHSSSAFRSISKRYRSYFYYFFLGPKQREKEREFVSSGRMPGPFVAA
jgi:hypothetical protein